MSKNNVSNVYDDDNIPEVDLPKDTTSSQATNSLTNSASHHTKAHSSNQTNAANTPNYNVEPLPESSRPRKDGPGGA